MHIGIQDKLKHDFNGNLERFKSSLVAKGLNIITRREGGDYNETCLSTLTINSFRIFITYYELELYHMDVKTNTP